MPEEPIAEEWEESPYPDVTACPRCGGPMEELAIEGVSLQRCRSCRGLWFDAGELEKVLALSPRPAIDEKQRSRPPAKEGGPKLQCPRCGGQLIKMHHLRNPQVTLDGCVVCYGTWLDAGDLAELQSPRWLDRAKDLLQGIFG